jgi:hypothetical protein
VKGGQGSVIASFSGRGRVQLVASTAPGHGNRGIRPGIRSRRLSRSYPGRRALGRGLYRARPRSARLIGVRRGRVRFVAVASSRLLRNRRSLMRLVGATGLRR